MPGRGSGASFAENASPRWKRFWNFPENDVVFYLEMKPFGSWGGEHALVARCANRERYHGRW